MCRPEDRRLVWTRYGVTPSDPARMPPRSPSLRSWCLLTSALCLGACLPQDSRAPSPPPNIVLIYVDDLGWRDLGVQGSAYYETPNVDALAAQGMRFTQAYANAPNCAPSRAALLSGLYAPRTGVYTVGSAARGRAEDRALIPVENRTALGLAVVTLPEGTLLRITVRHDIWRNFCIATHYDTDGEPFVILLLTR